MNKINVNQNLKKSFYYTRHFYVSFILQINVTVGQTKKMSLDNTIASCSLLLKCSFLIQLPEKCIYVGCFFLNMVVSEQTYVHW